MYLRGHTQVKLASNQNQVATAKKRKILEVHGSIVADMGREAPDSLNFCDDRPVEVIISVLRSSLLHADDWLSSGRDAPVAVP
jgi:hypothetical protein